MGKHPLIKRADILIILIVLGLGAGLLVYRWAAMDKGGDIICELYVDNKLESQIDLNIDGEVKAPGRENIVLTVKNHAIAFTQSDCPDKICVKTGYISRPGQTAVCLPNRVAIKITSKKPAVDAPDMAAW